MLTVTYTDNFDVSAASVFALLTDLEARATWIAGVLEVRVTPAGPAHLGSSYFEVGKFSGFKSEKTMIVTEFEQDSLLTLATEASVPNSFCESYRLESLTEKACRIHVTVEVGGAPKVAEFFMQQQMKKDQPQNFARFKATLAKRTEQPR